MSHHKSFPSHIILGSRVDQVTRTEMIDRLIEVAKDSKHRPVSLVKQYVELMERGSKDKKVQALINNFDYAVPEGVSVQWAGAFLYNGRRTFWRGLGLAMAIILKPSAIQTPFQEKFGGTVFTTELLRRCAKENVSIYLVGSPKNSDITNTADFIKKKFPGVTIAGHWPGELDGYRGAELAKRLPNEPVEADLVQDLRKTKPDIIMIAMGFPLQERIIAKLLPQLTHGILIGEGGTFDYDQYGGRLTKAPVILQRVGLEWLWRLILEPSRWRRQLAVPRFMWRVYRNRNHS